MTFVVLTRWRNAITASTPARQSCDDAADTIEAGGINDGIPKRVFESGTETIVVPSELRDRRFEVVMTPLDEKLDNGPVAQHPAELRSFGALPYFPNRERQGGFEGRQPLE